MPAGFLLKNVMVRCFGNFPNQDNDSKKYSLEETNIHFLRICKSELIFFSWNLKFL